MSDTIWVCKNCGQRCYPDIEIPMMSHWKADDKLCGVLIPYTPKSQLTSTQSKLSLAVEALRKIEHDLIPGDLYEGPTPYTEMFWAAQRIAKDCLKALETEVDGE